MVEQRVDDPEGDHEFQAHEIWDFVKSPDDVDGFKDHIPDDPLDMVWTRHFGKRVITDERPPTLADVQEVFREGEPHGWTENSFAFTKTMDGIKVFVLLSFDSEFRPELVTAYPNVLDFKKAEQSDRWSKVGVHHAYAHTLIETSDPFGNEWRQLEFGESESIEKYGHKLHTLHGADYARCSNCGSKFIGKGELKQRKCHVNPKQ